MNACAISKVAHHPPFFARPRSTTRVAIPGSRRVLLGRPTGVQPHRLRVPIPSLCLCPKANGGE